jgi:lysophospholipid acyltransferase (LPLAT)-like uncharacterized protein
MKFWLRTRVLPPLAAALVRLLGMTLRMRITGRERLERLTAEGGPVIFAFWHNRLLLLPYFYRRFFQGRKLVVMMSRSRDGQMVADYAGQFGVEAARGSTSKAGAFAYRQLLRDLEARGCDVGVTPDGPRGPRYVVQHGIIKLAQTTGRPIIGVTCHYGWKTELRSWDRFQIPWPFSKCELVLMDPLPVPEGVGEAGEGELARELARRLGV